MMTEKDPRENAYPLGKYPAINQDAILVQRSVAIHSYASLEVSLSMIFAKWLGTTPDVAGLVYFRITNTHARNRILDDLKRKRLDDQYNLFWNSLQSLIRGLDQRRNEIVHWLIVNNIDLTLSHEKASHLTLRPPAGWTNQASPSLNETDLADFSVKCDFASRAVGMFSTLPQPQLDAAWHDIFQQPITYPPPDTHPLSPNYRAPESPPP